MSIINVSSIDAADQDTEATKADLYDHLLAELVLWYSIRNLPAHRIARFKPVCKTWATWPSDHIIPLAKARRKDDTRDWYFPLVSTQTVRWMFSPRSWSWSGIWHATADQSSDSAQSLPPLDDLPQQWISVGNPRHDIIACSSGLLLIKVQTRHQDHTTRWMPLVVYNPLTRAFRELSAPNCADVGITAWDYRGVQVQMLVDEEANSYKVILTFPTCVCVHNSNTNSWTCNRFPEPTRPWGNYHNRNVAAWGYVCASACAGGRVYFADVQAGPIVDMPRPTSTNPSTDTHAAGFLRLFEMDEEAGTWKRPPHNRYPLRKWYSFVSRNFRDNHHAMSYDTRVLQYLNLVQCMGDLYVVIPARLHEIVQLEQTPASERRSFSPALMETYVNSGVNVMPLMFHIIQLQGAVLSHGLVRIEVPETRTDIEYRRETSFELTRHDRQPFRNWFSCAAVGSTIWVCCEDYLLEYNVLSRESRTKIVDCQAWGADILGFAYRPSFHMRP